MKSEYVDVRKPMPICPLQNMEEVVGKVLSLLEYGIEDPRRLSAGKSIMKQTLWEWYNSLPDAHTEVDDAPLSDKKIK